MPACRCTTSIHAIDCILHNHKPHVAQPRTDVPDPWGWAARGITNPDKETQR